MCDVIHDVLRKLYRERKIELYAYAALYTLWYRGLLQSTSTHNIINEIPRIHIYEAIDKLQELHNLNLTIEMPIWLRSRKGVKN